MLCQKNISERLVNTTESTKHDNCEKTFKQLDQDFKKYEKAVYGQVDLA